MAGAGVDQVVAIPTGGSGPSSGGGTMARIEGWWHRLPTWGKVVAVLVVIGLIVLVWLFIGGVAGSSNGGSAATLGGSGNGGGSGGAGPPPPPPPPQQLPSGPGGTDQPPPPGSSPSPSPSPSPSGKKYKIQPVPSVGPGVTARQHPKGTTNSKHPTSTWTSTPPVQTSEPVVSSTPAHGETTVPAYLPTQTYPANAASVKPSAAYWKLHHTGYSPSIRPITPQMGGGSNSAAVRLNAAFQNWKKSHPGGTSAQFSAALRGAAQNAAHNQGSQVHTTTAYQKKNHTKAGGGYAPQLRGANTPGMGSSSSYSHPKTNGHYYTHPSGLGTSVESKKTTSTKSTYHPNLRQYGA